MMYPESEWVISQLLLIHNNGQVTVGIQPVSVLWIGVSRLACRQIPISFASCRKKSFFSMSACRLYRDQHSTILVVFKVEISLGADIYGGSLDVLGLLSLSPMILDKNNILKC